MNLNLHQRPAFEAGDTAKFAVRVEFAPNLDPGFATPEEDLSWGRLQLWADGANLCEHVDRGEVRRSVEWYLLPFLEWLAQSWDFLFHEQRTPVANAGDTAWQSVAETNRPERFDRFDGWDTAADEAHAEWNSRHCLRSARFGGLFPDVVIRRWRGEVEISWGDGPIAGAPDGFRFLHGTGNARLTTNAVVEPLYRVLKGATDALVEAHSTSERLRGLLKSVTAINSAERRLARTTILAGLGQYGNRHLPSWADLQAKLTAELSNARSGLKRWFAPADDELLCVAGSCQAAVMFGSASPHLTEADVLMLARHLIQSPVKQPTEEWTRLTSSPEQISREESPWSSGYRLAREWTAKASVPRSQNGMVDIEGHLRQLDIRFLEIELNDIETAGLAVHPDDGAPQIFVNRRNPKCAFHTGKRFVLAHELCHLIHDKEHGRDLALISGPWAPRELEKRANAFAAALLMPPDSLRELLARSAGALDFQGLLTIARRLEVSPDALAHHMENCGFINEAIRDGLRAQLVNRPPGGSPRKPRGPRGRSTT